MPFTQKNLFISTNVLYFSINIDSILTFNIVYQLPLCSNVIRCFSGIELKLFCEEFLRKIEENCRDLPDNEQKLTMVRNKVLDKMKRTHRRERLSSRGSVCSIDSRTSSRTRLRSKEDDSDNDRATKQIKQQTIFKSSGNLSKLPARVSHQP